MLALTWLAHTDVYGAKEALQNNPVEPNERCPLVFFKMSVIAFAVNVPFTS
jgi:hypothetical protein